GRTGLEFYRCILVGRPFEAHISNHMTTALIGRHLLEEIQFAVKCSDAGRAENLMPGENIEICIDSRHVDRYVRSGLSAINQNGHTSRVRERHDLLDRDNRTERV